MPRNGKAAASAAPDPGEEVTRLARELGLTTIPGVLAELLREAEKQAPSYSEFASQLLGAEWRARRERRLLRGLKRARLGTVEGLDGFDFSIRPKLEPRVVRELANGSFVGERRNVICVGPPGRGKTRVAKALAVAACLRGESVLFTTTADMLDDIHGARADGTIKRVMRRYTKPRLLVCDEFGYLPLDRKMSDSLFRVVAARHGEGAMILTANTGFRRWKDFFPSEAQAVATVDRLIDRATILRFTGKGFRKPKDIYGAPLDDE